MLNFVAYISARDINCLIPEKILFTYAQQYVFKLSLIEYFEEKNRNGSPLEPTVQDSELNCQLLIS
ncbi:hypothetical protein ABEB36_015383 [Hypothenemus hampei]|uniref:Uncharacterized protein n=1 Tax=Hypothenemus hampei TaxID=57062 RepID=A0ABD1E101_HYPHA